MMYEQHYIEAFAVSEASVGVDAVGSKWLGSFWHPITSARQPGELYKSRSASAIALHPSASQANITASLCHCQ